MTVLLVHRRRRQRKLLAKMDSTVSKERATDSTSVRTAIGMKTNGVPTDFSSLKTQTDVNIRPMWTAKAHPIFARTESIPIPMSAMRTLCARMGTNMRQCTVRRDCSSTPKWMCATGQKMSIAEAKRPKNPRRIRHLPVGVTRTVKTPEVALSNVLWNVLLFRLVHLRRHLRKHRAKTDSIVSKELATDSTSVPMEFSFPTSGVPTDFSFPRRRKDANLRPMLTAKDPNIARTAFIRYLINATHTSFVQTAFNSKTCTARANCCLIQSNKFAIILKM